MLNFLWSSFALRTPSCLVNEFLLLNLLQDFHFFWFENNEGVQWFGAHHAEDSKAPCSLSEVRTR
jgi:hypothetical protein